MIFIKQLNLIDSCCCWLQCFYSFVRNIILKWAIICWFLCPGLVLINYLFMLDVPKSVGICLGTLFFTGNSMLWLHVYFCK